MHNIKYDDIERTENLHSHNSEFPTSFSIS